MRADRRRRLHPYPGMRAIDFVNDRPSPDFPPRHVRHALTSSSDSSENGGPLCSAQNRVENLKRQDRDRDASRAAKWTPDIRRKSGRARAKMIAEEPAPLERAYRSDMPYRFYEQLSVKYAFSKSWQTSETGRAGPNRSSTTEQSRATPSASSSSFVRPKLSAARRRPTARRKTVP